MSHAHHGHTYSPATGYPTRRRVWYGLPVALSLLAFALLEITAGSHIHNPVVIVDGGHNLTDAAAVGMCLILAFLMGSAAKLPLHRQQRIHNLETIVAITICLSTIGLVGWLALQQILHRSGVPHHLAEAAVLGFASFGLNRLLAWWLRRSGDTILRSVATHLYSDSIISLGIIAASGLTALVATRWWNILAAIVVLGFVIQDCRHVIADAWAQR